MHEQRSLGSAPNLCTDAGGVFFEHGYGASRSMGSPIGIGGETRITDVTIKRFTRGPIITFNLAGHPSSTEGAQPVYTKGIDIDEVSRQRLVHFAYPRHFETTRCSRRDCDGRKQAFIHDLDGSLTGLGNDASLLARSEFMHERTARSLCEI